jgi:hypothetical protein
LKNVNQQKASNHIHRLAKGSADMVVSCDRQCDRGCNQPLLHKTVEQETACWERREHADFRSVEVGRADEKSATTTTRAPFNSYPLRI